MKFLPVHLLFCGLILPFFLAGCSKKEKPLVMNDRTGRNIRVEPVPKVITTAMTVWAWNHFTEPFYLDSIFRNYTMIQKDNLGTLPASGDINVFFPQSSDPQHRKFNAAIKELIDEFYAAYEPGDTSSYTYMSAAMWVSDFSITRDIATTEFLYQSYYQGAAHYNHGFEALNYDLTLGKKITLTDILQFENDQQKQLFLDAYNPDPSISPDQVWLEPGDFSDDRNFLIEQEGIRLLFDDYEKGPSMTTHMIPYFKIRGYVNPEYRTVFE
jgi:hypothetical protein